MESSRRSKSVDRRQFLAATGGGLLAAAVPAGVAATETVGGAAPGHASAPTPAKQSAGSPSAKRKIPIGVFDPVYDKLSLDEMLDKVSALGLEAMEIGTGGYPGTGHCPIDELLGDPAKAKAWQKKFEDKGIQVATLSCHGNPVHPDAKHAARDQESFQKTVRLAEMIGVKVIVGFSGCPGGSPTDTQPNWITYRWPEEYDQMLQWQWKEKVVPYWKEAAKFARDHGIHRLAFEMHPNFVVYNPNADEIARSGGRRDRRELRLEPSVLARVRSGGSDSLPGKTCSDFPRAHEGHRVFPGERGEVRGI